MSKKVRLGSLLVEKGLISAAQLERALDEQRRTGRKLGRVLVDLGLLTDKALYQCLADHLKIDYVDLTRFILDTETARRLPEAIARRHRALLLRVDERAALVGMADPTDIFAHDQLAQHLGVPVRLALISEGDLLRLTDQVYRRTDEIESLAKRLKEELGEGDIDIGALAEEGASDAPVIRLIQSVFQDAVQVAASDIHLEPDAEGLRVRQRVDGLLQDQHIDGQGVAAAVVTRMKLMAGMDISEKRLPQDGRFSLRVAGRSIDVRASTLPLQHGESMVLRLLDQSGGVKRLAELGVPRSMEDRLRHLAGQSAGMLLVTGPTGSGKTTTLYALLTHLNQPQTKIITAEDPVEYRMNGIAQVQVNARIGLDFARVLRTALRQDPDVILVGEMRDRETVEIGLRAAMTGHLVLSTLHTVNAVATISRLLDMGAEGFLVAASLQGVVAQRLIRRLCAQCAEPGELALAEREWLAGLHPDLLPTLSAPKRAVGCPSCHMTGYRGRLGVYELLEIDTPLADAIRTRELSRFTELALAQPGYRPLTRVALDHVVAGTTTIAEVMRVASGVEEHASRSPGEPLSEAEVDATLAATAG